MAKRIAMRKIRLQKLTESVELAKKNQVPGVPGDHGDHAPKQTVSIASQNQCIIPLLSLAL